MQFNFGGNSVYNQIHWRGKEMPWIKLKSDMGELFIVLYGRAMFLVYFEQQEKVSLELPP